MVMICSVRVYTYLTAFLIRRATHLVALKFNNHCLDHAANLFKSFCNSWQSLLVWIRLYTLVSSANIFAVAITVSGKSLPYSKNKTGPRMEPCGTPLVTRAHFEVPFLRMTLYLLLDKNEDIQACTAPLIPMLCSFLSRRVWGTVSNALAKSKYTASTPSPSSIHWSQSYIGPCKGGSRDSGFKFQMDHRFWIQISKRQDSVFRI